MRVQWAAQESRLLQYVEHEDTWRTSVCPMIKRPRSLTYSCSSAQKWNEYDRHLSQIQTILSIWQDAELKSIRKIRTSLAEASSQISSRTKRIGKHILMEPVLKYSCSVVETSMLLSLERAL